jgi:hypothetical protein
MKGLPLVILGAFIVIAMLTLFRAVESHECAQNDADMQAVERTHIELRSVADIVQRQRMEDFHHKCHRGD